LTTFLPLFGPSRFRLFVLCLSRLIRLVALPSTHRMDLETVKGRFDFSRFARPSRNVVAARP
jgi:hypothetical protein